MIQWRPVKGWEDLYIVSSDGDICSIRTRKDRIIKRIMKPHTPKNGFLTITFNHCGRALCTTIAKVVATAFLDNPDNKHEVGHKDGNSLNNKVENLFWADREDVVYTVPVLNVTTGKVYKSHKEASEKLGVSSEQLRKYLELDVPLKGNSLASNNKMKGQIPDLENEEWQYLNDTDNQFKISNMGRVKSCSRYTACQLCSEMLCKVSIVQGRPVVHLRIYKDGITRRQINIPKAMVEQFLGILTTNKNQIRHKNGNLLDNRLSNLELI